VVPLLVPVVEEVPVVPVVPVVVVDELVAAELELLLDAEELDLPNCKVITRT